MSSVTYLNHLDAPKMTELSTKNRLRLGCIGSSVKNGSEATLARLPNQYKSQWHMFAPAEYLAMLDRLGIRCCIRFYNINDNGSAWAND